MKHTLTLLTALLLAPLAALHAADTKQSKRPNVIFILTDDQGWNDAHFAGHPYVKTPNLDRLAEEGTELLGTTPFSPPPVWPSAPLTASTPKANS